MQHSLSSSHPRSPPLTLSAEGCRRLGLHYRWVHHGDEGAHRDEPLVLGRAEPSIDSIATTMQTYTVFPIEPPVSPSQLAAYKTLRLASLQIDPHAFISTYAREVALSEDVWRQRLDTSLQRTFVASVMGASTSHARSHAHKDAGERGEWIGTTCIVGPSGLMMSPSVLAPLKEAGVGGNWEIYVLYAMWVHPAHRGKGVGVELVNACLEWARTNVDVKLSSENSGDFEKVVVLLVYDDNIAGHSLYSKAGFTDLEGVSGREGQRWMLIKV